MRASSMASALHILSSRHCCSSHFVQAKLRLNTVTHQNSGPFCNAADGAAATRRFSVHKSGQGRVAMNRVLRVDSESLELQRETAWRLGQWGSAAEAQGPAAEAAGSGGCFAFNSCILSSLAALSEGNSERCASLLAGCRRVCRGLSSPAEGPAFL
jgi:hypothetical protein